LRAGIGTLTVSAAVGSCATEKYTMEELTIGDLRGVHRRTLTVFRVDQSFRCWTAIITGIFGQIRPHNREGRGTLHLLRVQRDGFAHPRSNLRRKTAVGLADAVGQGERPRAGFRHFGISGVAGRDERPEESEFRSNPTSRAMADLLDSVRPTVLIVGMLLPRKDIYGLLR